MAIVGSSGDLGVAQQRLPHAAVSHDVAKLLPLDRIGGQRRQVLLGLLVEAVGRADAQLGFAQQLQIVAGGMLHEFLERDRMADRRQMVVPQVGIALLEQRRELLLDQLVVRAILVDAIFAESRSVCARVRDSFGRRGGMPRVVQHHVAKHVV